MNIKTLIVSILIPVLIATGTNACKAEGKGRKKPTPFVVAVLQCWLEAKHFKMKAVVNGSGFKKKPRIYTIGRVYEWGGKWTQELKFNPVFADRFGSFSTETKLLNPPEGTGKTFSLSVEVKQKGLPEAAEGDNCNL